MSKYEINPMCSLHQGKELSEAAALLKKFTCLFLYPNDFSSLTVLMF